VVHWCAKVTRSNRRRVRADFCKSRNETRGGLRYTACFPNSSRTSESFLDVAQLISSGACAFEFNFADDDAATFRNSLDLMFRNLSPDCKVRRAGTRVPATCLSVLVLVLRAPLRWCTLQ
jgi:hypothetical protein